MAFLFATIFKKSSTDLDLETENDHEDNGKSLNKYYKFQNFKPVRESKHINLISSQVSTDLNESILLKRINPFRMNALDSSHLNQCQLDAARNARIRELRIWQAFKEIGLYFLFMCVLFYVTYTNIGTSAFDYQNSMKKMFNLKEVI